MLTAASAAVAVVGGMSSPICSATAAVRYGLLLLLCCYTYRALLQTCSVVHTSTWRVVGILMFVLSAFLTRVLLFRTYLVEVSLRR